MCELKKNERRGAKSSIDEAALERRVDVAEAVGQRERDFLHRGRAGLADVVARDRDRVPLRHAIGAERDHVGDQLQGRAGRIDVGAARRVLLEDVVLDGAAHLRPVDALLLRHHQVEREQDRRRRVDGHRGGDAIERDAVEQPPHVVDAVDGDTDAADLAARRRRVGVVADLGRQVEGDREPGRPLLEQVAVAAVRFGGARVPGVLAHGPQPLAVGLAVEAPGVGEAAGVPERPVVVQRRGGIGAEEGGLLGSPAGPAQPRRKASFSRSSGRSVYPRPHAARRRG